MRYRFFIMFMLGLLIIVLLVHYIGLSEVIREVKKLDTTGFLGLLSIQTLMMILWGCKWRLVLRHFDVSFCNVLPVNMVGYMLNNTTPLGMAGGESAKAYILSKIDNISTEESAASVIIDIFLDIFPLMVMILISIFLIFMYNIPIQFVFVLVLAAIVLSSAVFLVIMLLVNKEFSMRILHCILRYVSKIPLFRAQTDVIKRRVNQIVDDFQSAMQKTATDRTILLFGALISSVILGLSILRTYIVFNLIGISIDLPILVIVQVSVSILSFVSFLPGAIGIWEGLSVMLYSFVGISAPSAMAATIIDRFFSFWVGSFMGLMAAACIGLNLVMNSKRGGASRPCKRY